MRLTDGRKEARPISPLLSSVLLTHTYLLHNPKSIGKHTQTGKSLKERPKDKARFSFPTSLFFFFFFFAFVKAMGTGKGRASRRWTRSALFWVTALAFLVSESTCGEAGRSSDGKVTPSFPQDWSNTYLHFSISS